jgi:hypothetical protein
MFYLLEVYKMITREKLLNEYLDWRNNYFSVEVFAEHRGLTVPEAEMLLALSKSCFTNLNPEA